MKKATASTAHSSPSSSKRSKNAVVASEPASTDMHKLVASLQSKVDLQAKEIKSNTKELQELKLVIQSLVLSLTASGPERREEASISHHRKPLKRIVLCSEESGSESEEVEAPAKRKNTGNVRMHQFLLSIIHRNLHSEHAA